MCYNPFSLKDKVILVTGASSGIGRAIAVACSRMGAKLVITARNTVCLEETYNMLEGKGHLMICADLTVSADIEMLVDRIPYLDGVVQNAGCAGKELCKNISSESFQKIMSLNVEAPVFLQKVLLEHKKLNKMSSVVFIASRAAALPVPGNAVYSASKGAIISYAKVLASEVAPRKIRVNCICPAMVWSNLILADGMPTRIELEQQQQKYPLKRYGTSEDIAYLAVYLLSDAASWMTGSAINIDGGTQQL